MTFTGHYKQDVLEAIGSIDLEQVDLAIEWFREARDAGRRIFVCGNGGSACTTAHFVCEVLKSASYQRAVRFRIMALSDALATITAYANDVGYDSVFVEQLRNFAEPGDLFMGLSGSGNSINVVRAIEYANSIGCRTIALTGRGGGPLRELAQLSIHIPSTHQGRSEDAQMVVCHMIAYYFIENQYT